MLRGKAQLQSRLSAIGRTEVILRSVVIHGVREAKLLVPRRTGNLGRTIRPGRVTARYASILAGGERDVGYAAAVEQGTRPRVIVPRPGRIGRNGRPAALAWGGGRTLAGRCRSGSRPTHFARLVHHPGSRPRPYLVPGLRIAAERQIGPTIVTLWNGAA